MDVSASMQAALDGDANLALLYTFMFGTGTYGLWTGVDEISYNGLVYRAGGSLIDIGTIKQSVNGSVGRMTMTLSTDEDKGLTDDVLVRLYDEDWHNKPVTLQLATVNDAFSAVIDAVVLFRGRIDPQVGSHMIHRSLRL